MSKIDIILIFLNTASAFGILTLSLVTLAARNKKKIHYISALVFFLYGITILSDMRSREGTAWITPNLLYLTYPSVFFLAPLLFLYLQILLNEEFSIKKRHLLLFIPGAVILLALTPFFLQDAETKLALYPLTEAPDPRLRLLALLLKNSPATIILLSFTLSLRSTIFLWNRTALQNIKIIRNVLIYMAGWVLLAGLFIISAITRNLLLYRVCCLVGNGMLFLYFILTYRDPEFFYRIQKESKEIQHSNSRLKGINIREVLIKLEKFMVEKELYRENSLTLKSLSGKLNIRPDQLSEILNSSYNLNFNQYINNFRIEQIKEKLIENPEGNILHVAFGCGFNSKTTFNKAFRNSTGMTPSQFREKKGTES